MKKILATLSAALMIVAFFGVTQATAEPGPNGSNDKGLCTAFFNGQKRGHDKDGDGLTDSARPFQALETAAGAVAGASEEVAAAVYEFCLTLAGQDGTGVEIGGNPDENGRWTCTVGEGQNVDDASDDTYTCTPNEPKGNGKGPGAAPA